MGASQDDTVYLVLEDFGSLGQAYRETDPSQADRQTVLSNLLSGEYRRPLRIVAFNTKERWARDVTAVESPCIFDFAGRDLASGGTWFEG